jgi:hypothetical protein
MPSTTRRPTGDPSLLTSPFEHHPRDVHTFSGVTSAIRHIFRPAPAGKTRCHRAAAAVGCEHDVATLIFT